MARSASLVADDVSAGYGSVNVLDHVSVKVDPGTITAVLGANGAGKTTLLRTISGFVRARSGRVTLDGTSLTRRRPEDIARAGVAHVPEGQGIITELTVEENLRLGLLLRNPGTRANALNDVYQKFSVLAERRRKAAATLSGGERQMLAIARAVLTGPRVLLLDEPSLGLGPKIVTQVMAMIRQLRDEGMTVLLVEQNARSALAIADRGVVLNVGRVVAETDAAELAADVQLRRHYLGF